MHKQIVIVAVTLFTSSVFVYSTTDTPETRRREAERYRLPAFYPVFPLKGKK